MTFAYFWLVSIKSNIFIRSTLCFNPLCSTTLSHRHVASEDSRRQESSSSYCSYCCHVPCLFPVPFQCLFQCLFTVCVRLPVILPCDSLFCKKEIAYLFVSTKLTRNTFFAGRATKKCKRHWKRHWKGTGKGLGTDTAHGNSKNSSWNRPASLENNTRMCACRSPVAVHTQYRLKV